MTKGNVSATPAAPRNIRGKIWVTIFLVASALAIGIHVLLPSSGEPGEPAWRAKCASNLAQIYRAISMYAVEHHNACPDSFVTLLRTEDLVPEVFICQKGTATQASSRESFAGSLDDCDYIYCGDGVQLDVANDDVVIALDRRENHDRDGMNVACGDGHVEYVMIHPWGDDPIRWAAVQDQIERKVRPVRWPTASTKPAR